ncbi:MAG: hypothetical protein HYY84_00580 [Deltaproteobacteria bacterium]|nr:hypothetical protein [Deltaproteobacteria bacterium]
MQSIRLSSYVAALVMLAFASPSVANDRLPTRLHAPYRAAWVEVEKYTRFILKKVWEKRLAEAKAKAKAKSPSGAVMQDTVDDIVHIVLPFTKRILNDVVFGTGETHLRLTMPKRGKLALAGRGVVVDAEPLTSDPVEAARQAVDALGSRPERDLHDQLEQALTEDLDHMVERHVERAFGKGGSKGRPRKEFRTLSSGYEATYAQKTRPEIHRFAYWWLRAKKRNELTQLAASLSQPELDRAQHRGAIWGLTSNVSREAWSQIRLDIDFKFGRPNWEIDRRRIRRRIDQDLAQGTWALAKLVKELTAIPTLNEADEHLAKRLQDELSKSPNREKAEQYPVTRDALQKELQRLTHELDPIFNRVMARVKLPADMKSLAEEHGRRFMREGYGPKLARAIDREAAPIAAFRRVVERLPGVVRASLRGFDPGNGLREGTEEWRRGAKEHVKRDVGATIDDEIEGALREAGLDTDLKTDRARRGAIKRVWRRFEIDRSIEGETERQIDKMRRGE